MASLTGLTILAVTALYGGWEWALLSFAVLMALWPAQFRALSMLVTLGVSLVWLALFHSTGDRRLFFPFATQLAIQMRYLMEGRISRPTIGGVGVIVGFLLIRVVQSATFRVLVVELFVAAAILALVSMLCSSKDQNAKTRLLAGILGSALAFAGLAF